MLISTLQVVYKLCGIQFLKFVNVLKPFSKQSITSILSNKICSVFFAVRLCNCILKKFFFFENMFYDIFFLNVLLLITSKIYNFLQYSYTSEEKTEHVSYFSLHTRVWRTLLSYFIITRLCSSLYNAHFETLWCYFSNDLCFFFFIIIVII